MPARIHITCTIEGCDRPHYGRGLCQMHYLRVYRHGSVERRTHKRQTCTIEGCERPARGRGLCQAHYARWYNGSANTEPITPVSGAAPRFELPDTRTREQWLAWAAGFFDGEGCITIVRAGKGVRYYLDINVAQADPAPLKIMQALFGGRLATHGQARNRPVYYWKASTQQAFRALNEMLPYLVVKREQAECAKAFNATFVSGKRADSSVMEQREALCQRLAFLKHRGYAL